MMKNYVIVDRDVFKILGKKQIMEFAMSDPRTLKTKYEAYKQRKQIGKKRYMVMKMEKVI